MSCVRCYRIIRGHILCRRADQLTAVRATALGCCVCRVPLRLPSLGVSQSSGLTLNPEEPGQRGPWSLAFLHEGPRQDAWGWWSAGMGLNITLACYCGNSGSWEVENLVGLGFLDCVCISSSFVVLMSIFLLFSCSIE